MTQHRRPRLAALIFATCAAATALTACGGGTPPLPGKRVAVMTSERHIEPDRNAAGRPSSIGAPMLNPSWPQAGGEPHHAMGHLALADQPQRAWSVSIGAGASDSLPLLGTPVIADGQIVAIDAEGQVRALDAATGGRRWSMSVRPEKERGDAPGGGVAIDGKRVYVGSGYAEVLALEADTGAVIWRKKVSGPVRGAPTVSSGRVFVLTLDNQVVSLSAQDGSQSWSHTGIIESAGLLAGNSVAVSGGMVVAPFSSGEIYGLRAENGRVVWQENLSTIQSVGSTAALSDIRGLPVVDRGVIFAISNGGRLAAVDERSGGRVWEQDIGGMQTPWVAGDQVFVVTGDAQVVALQRNTGAVRWVAQLERYDNPKKRADPIAWAGPLLAGGRLWLTGGNGKMLALSPENGATLATIDLAGRAFLPPIVAGGVLYVLTDNGTLTAYR